MSLPAFDTHDYVKKLQAAGFNEKQAEAQADLQSQVLSSLITDKLATKEDLNELRAEVQQGFMKIEGRFNLLNWMIGLNSAAILYIASKLFLLKF
jgi:hypothetical protein